MYLKALTVSALALSSAALAQDAPPWNPGEREYSQYPGQDFPNQILFGDTHLHTSYSVDAGMIGNTLGPDEAYRYAKGETVTSSMGVKTQLIRPLDWLVISDHAEALGVAPMIARSDPIILEDPLGQELHALVMQGTADAAGEAFNLFTKTKADGTNTLASDPNVPVAPWEEIIDAAEVANEPGRFTALIGFEWTSAPNGNNLHRVVVFKDGKDVANSRIPLSSDLDPNPEALWDWMEEVEAETGGSLLAIPHNGNLSNGLMFNDTRYGTDEPINADYAARRQRWEPIYEVTQMKGDGEAHPMLSPDDPFADFETWDTTSLGGFEPKVPEMVSGEYAREALKRGLAHGAELGANPWKFGVIGSTDAHTSLASTRENNFFGKVAQLEPTADPIRFEETVAGRLGPQDTWLRAWQTSASGLAAVWARDNTREEIFDAMMRREVFATTGTRIRVRVFAGYDFEESDLPRSDFAAHGYANGVPMGGDLETSEGRAPRFLIRALRDPDGANLDRVQVIKGWLNADGTTSEKVYDVSCGGREIVDGACDGPVGNSVDAQEATYTNDIGQAILGGYWEDPDFEPTQSAFYYVRVLEIPTPRWTTFDRKFFGVELPEGAPESIQDRAYTSPIWYTP